MRNEKEKHPHGRSTIHDVAMRANVSTGTVSHVLNGSAPTSEETRRRVMEAIEELNYHRNENARALRTANTKTIGIILQDIISEYYAKCTMRILECAQQEGYSVLSVCTHRLKTVLQNSVNELVNRQVSGVIFVGGESDESCHEVVRAAGIPMVFADRFVENFPCVEFDNYSTMYKLAHAFYRQGYRKFSYFGVSENVQQNLQRRFDGLREGMKDLGVPEEDFRIILVDDVAVTNLREVYKTIAERIEDFVSDAGKHLVLASSDISAQAMIYALTEHGVRVPEDVGVFGFDNNAITAFCKPSLSTVEQNPYELGEKTFGMLMQQIQHPDQRIENIMLEQKVILRESVRLNAEIGRDIDLCFEME